MGETKRTLTTRLKEHKAACGLGAFVRSAVAKHAWQEGHEIDWNDIEILDTAKDLQERKVKESLYIRIVCLMNRDRENSYCYGPSRMLRRETKTSPSTNPETGRQPTATRNDSAPMSLGSGPTHALPTGDTPTSSQETYAHLQMSVVHAHKSVGHAH